MKIATLRVILHLHSTDTFAPYGYDSPYACATSFLEKGAHGASASMKCLEV